MFLNHEGLNEYGVNRIYEFFKNTMKDEKKAQQFYELAKTVEEEKILEEQIN